MTNEIGTDGATTLSRMNLSGYVGPKFRHITPILKSLHWLKVSERIEYKIISLTKLPLSLRISMTSYLLSLLTVTTHALHLMSLWSNHHHHSNSLITPSDMLHLILGTSFLHHSEFLIRITHPLYATFVWTCRFNLLHTAISFDHFSLFHSELKTYLFRKSYSPP